MPFGEVMLFKVWCGNWRTQRLHSRDSRVMFFHEVIVGWGFFFINSLILSYRIKKNFDSYGPFDLQNISAE
jgi:choline-glycine betaine transporter